MLVLIAALMLTSAGADLAMARGGGGHGGGGGRGGGGFHGAGFGGYHGGYGGYGRGYGGYGRGGYYGGYGRGFYGGYGGWGYGLGGYGYGGYGYPTFSGYGSYPYYDNGLADPASSNFYDAVPAAPAGPQPQYTNSEDNTAHVRVVVPDPNAVVKVDGQPTESGGTVRNFQSPPLSPGNYSYEVKATWNANGKPVTETHTVKVQPGAEALVTFTQPQQ